MSNHSKINRNTIYIGSLYQSTIDEDKRGEATFGDNLCRTMLFTINDDLLAEDLIYSTPVKYPIYNRSNSNKGPFIICNAINIGSLLSELNYPEELEQKDLKKIYRQLIKTNYLDKKLYLFGIVHFGYYYELLQSALCSVDPAIFYSIKNMYNYSTGKPSKVEPYYQEAKKLKRG